jgi:hypothetical protein
MSLPLTTRVKSQSLNIPKNIDTEGKKIMVDIDMSAELEKERRYLEKILEGSQKEVINIIPAEKEQQESNFASKKLTIGQLSPLSSFKGPKFDK